MQAAVCNPAAFQGAYGFQLSGTTTISGAPQPAAAVGRLVLDGSGGISGVSSVKFTGLLLGNPVTGMYEAKADCSVSWSLQDDSGNSQHFEGTMTQDGARITFHQSDAGGARDGVMQRLPTSCSAGDFRGRYSLSVSGSSIDVDTNKITGTLSQSGQIEADGQGNVSFIASPSSAAQHAGTFEIGDDCFVQLALQLSTGNDTVQWKFRAVVVNGGRELIGIESDPGTVATLRLTSK
ncbi:MAG: hypothetical protein JO099_21405 [Acidobacteriia bacterium]|nr:hypothetical protein [Terriglobia bacterium]